MKFKIFIQDRVVLSPKRDNIIIIKAIKGNNTHRCYLSEGDTGHTDHPRTKLNPKGILLDICLFVVFAPALLVKGTGKG